MGKSFNRVLAMILAVCFTCFMAAGCTTPKATDAASAGSQNTDAATAASQPPAEKVTVNYLSFSSGTEADIETASIDAFNKTVDYTVVPEFCSEEFQTKLNTLIAAGTPPDMTQVPEYLPIEWGRKGVLTDLAKLGQINVDDYMPGTVFLDDGKIYGLGDACGMLLLYYSKDMFKEANIPTPSLDANNPWTWDQVLDAAKKLTDTSGDVKKYGMLAPTSWICYLPLLYGNDARIASEDGKTYTMNSPEAVFVMQSIADAIFKYNVAPTPAVAESIADANQMMMDKQLGMRINGHWGLAGFSEKGFYNIGVAPLPKFKHSASITWSGSFSIFEKSACKKEAFDFLMYRLDPSHSLDLFQGGAYPPSNKNFVKNPDSFKLWASGDLHKGNEDYATTIPSIIGSDYLYLPENVSLINFGFIMDQIISPEMDKLWMGEADAQTVLDGIADRVQEKLEGSYMQ